MSTLNFLYKREYAINDKIHVMIPSVGDILDNEDDYYSIVSMLTAMPIDLMTHLDDLGLDFTTINDYDVFLLMFGAIQKMDTHLIFGDLDLSKFDYRENPQNGRIILRDDENDITIDRWVQGQIAAALRKIHHLEKNLKKPANKEAQDYMLLRARQKMSRRKRKVDDSQLESMIIAMVNTEQFKYGFEETRELSIYQFNESVRQVVHKVDYQNKMFGIYSGNIDPKGLSRDELNWLIHK